MKGLGIDTPPAFRQPICCDAAGVMAPNGPKKKQG